ncbi:MAG TPA: hypothetical protein VG308_07140 [Stellaceae bacterium]|jgi:hypothetical protein|nr:hypothetical protein [Stellaceae bacterium]
MPDRPLYLSRLALPLAWEALDREPSPEDCGKAAWSNAGVLGFLLHGIELDAAQRPADERLAEALAPLRIKLDVVIEMLGRLAYRDLALPPVRDIELGMDRLVWHSPQSLRAGDWLRFSLYFDPSFLEPIVLYGRVSSAIPDDAGGSQVQAELTGTSLETEEAVTRLAFLAQRRQLAQRPATAARAGR